MTKLSLAERVKIAEQKINLSPKTQVEIINIVKNYVNAELLECKEYYSQKDYPMGLVYSIESAIYALENSKIDNVYQLNAALYDIGCYYPMDCQHFSGHIVTHIFDQFHSQLVINNH
jgi:hypothetical protein